MTLMFHYIVQKLNRAKTENSEHFTINSRSKYATVLNDPEAHSELMYTTLIYGLLPIFGGEYVTLKSGNGPWDKMGIKGSVIM